MKTEPQNQSGLARLCKLIEGLPVAMLTTPDADGSLISRPMSPLLMDAQGAIWFFTDRNAPKVEQLARVNLSFTDADDGTYVSVSGRGELVDDRERIRSLWTAFAKPWFPDGPESPNLALLKIVPHSAEYWDAPNSKMVRMLAMAASVVAGEPIGMGEHDKLGGLSKPHVPA